MTLRMRFFVLIVFCFLLTNFCDAQKLNFHCIEQYQKSENSDDSIIIQTCFLNDFKFVVTSYPDYAGRYVYSEHKVFALHNEGYTDVTNSDVFNRKQSKLVTIINKKFQQDFKQLSTNTNTKDCLTEIDSIPIYKMDDFQISFNDDEIWFEVKWGLSSACRSVDGTIVSFKIDEIKKYLQ